MMDVRSLRLERGSCTSNRMLRKLFYLLFLVAVSNAVPVWYGNPYSSHMFFRNADVPSIAFGFGSGFSSDFGGIRHSSSFGNSFQSGNGQAYGAGFGSSDGNTIARGIGYAQIPQPNFYQFRFPSPQGFQATATSFNAGGRSFASAQSFGNQGSAISSAQSIDGVGSAVSAVQNNGRFQSAISSVNNLGHDNYGTTIAGTNSDGQGFESVISRADNIGGYKTAIASTQGLKNIDNFGQRISESQNIGRFRNPTYNVQHREALGKNSGAIAINGPDFQIAQSHSINK